MRIGENIKRKRTELDMTLDEVAKQIGISRQTMSRYETGVISNIPSDKIEQLANVLRTTPASLMGWGENGQSRDEKGINEEFLSVLGQLDADTQNKLLELARLYLNDLNKSK